ncbi:DUF448 domain-containing protein [Altererythrobacter salegens]|uniref:DUF448 domain-containing protein n=1 Tax=Croceibacterium salegens TaxID=1737568 RepID=A0A6I4SU98_9SPHN|nr:DUF448 domain-containing protein [Croceibacterium salegens]MXO58540.1 DUF448 domain-containing protein [Croceibacterium salegens]
MRNPRNEPLGEPDTAGAADPASGPERRCVLTGRTGSRDEFVRLAVSPDGDVLPDALARAPGRGAWIGVGRAELQAAIDNGKLKGALARAFKGGALAIPADLAEKTENALRKAFADRLGLEMRAGRLILGSDRIANEARMGKVAALYHAADASDDGSRKLDQAWRVGQDAEGSGLCGLRLPLDRAALSVALGRDNVVHLALADVRSAERIAVPLQRLLTFLGAVKANEDCGHEAATTE